MQVLVGEKVEFDNIAFCGEEVDDGDAVACSAPLEVGQVPVLFRRLVGGMGCIG